jgi:membrane protein
VNPLKLLLIRLKASAVDTWKQILDAQLFLTASSLAYTTLLSVIPLLAVSFAIFQAFGGMEKLYSTIEPLIIENLAEGSGIEAMEAIRRFIGNIRGGALGAGGFIALILTSMSMPSSIEKAMNRVWKAPMNRSLFQRVAAYWLLITMGPIALSIVLGAASTTDYPITRFLPSGTSSFLMAWFILFCVYKWVPNRLVHHWPALLSALLIASLWNFVRLGFAFYTKHFLSYNKIYGSLGALPILLLWIYVVWIMILTGAAMTAAFQKRLDLK